MISERRQQDNSTTVLDQCLDQIRFVHATELSRSGKYLEAEALLAPDGRFPESPRELDLLARIAAQQERFDAAAHLWKAALEHDPDNPIYKESLQRLSDLPTDNQLAAPPRGAILGWCVAVAAILLLITLFISAHRTPTQKPDTTATAGPTNALQTTPITDSPAHSTNPANAPAITSPAQSAFTESLAVATAQSAAALSRLEQRLAQLQHTNQAQIQGLNSQLLDIQATNLLLFAQVDKTESRLAHLAQSIAEVSANQAATHRAIDSARTDITSLLAAHAPATNISPPPPPVLAGFDPAIPGVTVATTTNACLIRFDPALFDRDCHFKIGAKARLQSLAKALVQTQARIKVQVIGIADDEPSTWPWSAPHTPEARGFQRAQCATAYLLRLGIFPPDKLSATAGTPAQRPFPSPDRNNRTVMLQVLTDPTGQPAKAP